MIIDTEALKEKQQLKTERIQSLLEFIRETRPDLVERAADMCGKRLGVDPPCSACLFDALAAWISET